MASAADMLVVRVPVVVSEQKVPLPLPRPPHVVSAGTSGLLFRTKPHALFSMAAQFVTWCTAPAWFGSPAAGAPPSLKPLPSPFVLFWPAPILPFAMDQEFSITTTSFEANKSQPSSALFQARQPLNTLPGPM